MLPVGVGGDVDSSVAHHADDASAIPALYQRWSTTMSTTSMLGSQSPLFIYINVDACVEGRASVDVN